MKSHLILTPTGDMSEADWLYFRFVNGLGASDIGCVLGLVASWKSPIELFYEKLDFALSIKKETKHMFFGSEMEDKVCEWYQYWEGSMDSIVANFRAGKKVRKVERVNAYIQNPKYPWLYCSLDRRVVGEDRVLEAKWVSDWVMYKYVEGIPPSHMVQVQTQMLVTEYGYGDLATLVDKEDYNVYSFSADEEIMNTIVERTKDFWDRVLAARIIVTQLHEATISHNMRLKGKLEVELAALEPALIGGDAEELFLKDKFKKSLDKSIGTIKGTDEDLATARKLKDVKDQMKALAEEASLHQNILMNRIGNNVALDFGKLGEVSWRGDPRRFSNKIKVA